MNDKLKAYLDELFADAPKTKKALELKEEMLQNLIEKYEDLRAQGKSEEDAYHIAISNIGDISSLLEELEDGRRLDAEAQKVRRRSALLTAVAVMLYILSVLPIILLEEHFELLGITVMFIMIALATGLLVFNNMSKPKYRRADDTMVEEFREWKASQDNNNTLRKSISGVFWMLVVALYFILSFTTGAWYITWVIYLIAAAVEGVISAVFNLKR